MILRCADCDRFFDSYGDPEFYQILVDENRSIIVCDACLEKRNERDRLDFERAHAWGREPS